MKRSISDKILGKPLFARDWERDIQCVTVEPCDEHEDPLGYKAVYHLSRESARAEKKKSFVIGASFLAQRSHNLEKAGYKVPMTKRAIEAIEAKIGGVLPMFDLEDLARRT